MFKGIENPVWAESLRKVISSGWMSAFGVCSFVFVWSWLGPKGENVFLPF